MGHIGEKGLRTLKCKGYKFSDDIMAAAEARAAWQRTANRCFMQEDAKRAPKLACCPGAASSKSQCDSSHCDSGNGVDHSSSVQLPNNWNSNMNMSPETRWWLQWQPSFGNQRDFMCENFKDKKYQTDYVEMNSDLPRSFNSVPDRSGNADVHEDSTLADSTTQDLKREDNVLKNQNIAFRTVDGKGIGADNSYGSEYPREDQRSCQDCDNNIVKTEDLAILEGYEKYARDMTTSRSRYNGCLWWRTADENELATLVAQKSSEHIENCDLPPPQFMQIRKVPLLSVDELCYRGVSEPIVHHQEKLKAIQHNVSSSSSNVSKPTSPLSVCGNMDSVPLLSGESHYSSTNAGDRAPRSGGTIKTWTEGRQSSESEGEKAQLLEALCHSQTRAREAEIAAAQAFSEKDKLLRLFLKEASHLFAYRQWFRLLQIETVCLKIKAKDQSVSWDQLRALFPLFPLMPMKQQRWVASKTSSNKRHKIGQQKFDVSAWALAVALGLSLAGAGLFLGWSMGWLLPMF
ncbi:uncharacterized protein LOC131044964 isoform X1 [Cryptomeria japonica]|uniref:uncharacterized protein LOC131044964 isoform X1 n=2 Tax=Cryptomeria japonica TaxID=3369 RepID=UPI0025AB889D|nr:uncharacterized protein LOC131044964 isoform X1 [Cryptomeria japonica]